MAGKSKTPSLQVVDSDGRRQPFLRGMVTHDLVQRGLGFDEAYAVARTLRDRLADRHEVTTEEIRGLIVAELETRLGIDLPAHLRVPRAAAAGLTVHSHGRRVPFSRGLLAHSIHAAGVDLDRAYHLVAKLEEGTPEGTELPSGEIARRVAELLERLEGAEAAERYRLVRRIHRLPRPLVIFVGGASGTGKSTLALGLAPLLRIYRINATDTIRQVMRMVFSPQVLPAIHTSSYEAPPAWDEALPLEIDPEERLIASFTDQAARVNVGVRAVVERAVAENMSIVVEGVHLYPPLVPFADLEGAAYQVPLVLASRDPESHRTRFLARARLGGRRAERYLEHFGAIRQIHDFLLDQAEAHDVPLLDTSAIDTPVVPALRLLTSWLRRQVPALASSSTAPAERPPVLLLFVDGLPDRPIRSLAGRTPLEAASTPNLDRLAREGRCGLADAVAPGVVPDTAAGSLAIFGQSPQAMKRGPVEALGAGLRLEPGDVALRGNLATLNDDGLVIDRRAGRIRDAAPKLAAALDRMVLPGSLGEEVEIRVKAATEHRLAIVLRGEGLSSDIVGSDPGDAAIPAAPLVPRPLDPGDERAVHTARALALFEEKAQRVLARHRVNRERIKAGLPPAGVVLTRGAGRIHRLVPLEENGLPLSLACISGDRTVLGLASWLGAATVSGEGMTANLDTDLDAKLEAAALALAERDLVVVHVKGADIAAHDRRAELKVEFLERLDRALGTFLERWKGPLRIAVASDHATLSESGQHAADPLPILIWGSGVEADAVETFSEGAVVAGDLRRFPLQTLLGRLFELT